MEPFVHYRRLNLRRLSFFNDTSQVGVIKWYSNCVRTLFWETDGIGKMSEQYILNLEGKMSIDIWGNKRINTKHSNCITWSIYSYTRVCRIM